MNGLSLPLDITGGRLMRCGIKESIDRFLSILISTPLYTGGPDAGFGFSLNNLRFEVVSESDGIISVGTMESEAALQELYGKKLSGSSSNHETFAFDLKKAIENYEKRLDDVTVTMTYMKEARFIHINIKAIQVADGAPYQYSTSLRIWN